MIPLTNFKNVKESESVAQASSYASYRIVGAMDSGAIASIRFVVAIGVGRREGVDVAIGNVWRFGARFERSGRLALLVCSPITKSLKLLVITSLTRHARTHDHEAHAPTHPSAHRLSQLDAPGRWERGHINVEIC